MSAANWSNPTLSSTYTNFLADLKSRDEDAAMMFDVGAPTNVPTDAIKFAKSSGVFQKWTGAVWTTVQLKTAAIENSAITTALIADVNVTASKLASGAAASNLGFTPANKVGDTFTGAVAISAAAPQLSWIESDNANKTWLAHLNASTWGIYEDSTANARLTIAAGASALALGVGTLTYGGSTIWHAGNDGSASGLDADTTDGQHLATSNTPQWAGIGLGATWDSAGIMNISATGMTSNSARRGFQINATNTTQTLTGNRVHHGGLFQFTNSHTDASGFFVTAIGVEVNANSGAVGVAGKLTDLVGVYAVTQNLTDQASNNTVVNAYGFKSFLRANATNSAITNAYGVLSEINAASASVIGTAFLFYGAYTGTAPTNNRGIRLVAEGYSQFDGSLGLGITPTQKLHVSGNALLTGTVTVGTQYFGGGSQAASAPDYSFTGDTDTGVRRTGADTLALVTASTDRLTVGSTGLIGINQAPATYQLGISGTLNATTLNEGGVALTTTYARLAVANTFSVPGQIIAAGNSVSTGLAITSTEAGAADWPAVVIDRQSGSPAASDVLGSIVMQGKNSGAVTKIYAALQAEIVDAGAASEDGKLAFRTMVAGTDATRGYVAQGLVIGSPTGADKGVGTINASTLYFNGQSLAGKQILILPASAFRALSGVDGPGSTTFQTTTNKVVCSGWGFSPTVVEQIQAMFSMPKSWNKGAFDLTIRGVRHTGTGTSAAVFKAKAAILDSGDAMDIAFGSEVAVTVTPNTTIDIQWQGLMSSVTPSGTTSDANSTLILNLRRDPADASDADATNDFIVLEAFIVFTTNAPTED